MSSTLPVRHHYTDVAAGRLHRLEYPGPGAPLVCLHGVTGCAWAWHEVADQLAGVATVHAVDMRGHGDSLWAARDQYGTHDHVGDLLAQIDSITDEPVDIAGSSWGALVAIEFAAAYPDRVRQLVVVDIEPSFAVSSTDVPPRPRTFANTGEVVAWLRANHPNAPDAALSAMAGGAFRPAPDGALTAKHDPVLYEVWPFRDEDHWAALANVKAPTLLIRASATFVRADVVERMRDEIPNATFAQFEDTVHVISVDSPTQLATTLQTFLSTHAERSS